jgi:hypothetical protein
LQQLIGVFQKISELVSLSSHDFGRELRGDLYARDRRILGHVADLVHLDRGFSRECRLELFCQRGGLGIACGKGADEP